MQTKIGNVSLLTFQLKSTWDEATEDEKEVCIEKAMEGCNGQEVLMPNVFQTVTCSIMISQYLMFCEEEQVVPLRRATLFRILEVKEASQQRLLCGLDNTAAEGSAGFERIFKIVDNLQQMGQEKSWAQETKKSIQDGKRYFKTGYPNHCQQDESTCPDHCLKFGLGDPSDSDLKEQCAHEHTTLCGECDGITICLDKIAHVVKSEDTKFYSREQQEDILYDFEQSRKATLKN